MLIKKRWTWLTSVMLLGLLVRAGRRDANDVANNALGIVEEPLMMNTVVDVTVEEPSTKELVSFPYAIDSSPSLVYISAMLSYCTYHESTSMEECKEFWEQSCDTNTFHQFQLGGLNAVTVCKNEDRVYVAFAGTQSLSDCYVDGSFFSKGMNFSKKNVFAHGGFTERAKEYKDWVMKTLSSVQGIDKKEIVLTGHSLGAASATLLAHHVYEGLDLNTRGGASNSLNQVKVIGFGSPSAMLDPKSYFLGHLNHIRFYNPYDPVATFFASWSGYGHVGVQLAIPDGPARHLARAANLLNRHKSLKLLRQLPLSYWFSLPPLVRTRFDLGFDAHAIDSYAILADAIFADFQKKRHISRSDTSIINAGKVLSERLGAPVTCYLQNEKVVCLSGNDIVAKFRYAMDALPIDKKADSCMASLVSSNLVPGVTMNAGISIENNMSAVIAASEALVLEISDEDRWYEKLSTKTLNALYLDGLSSLPMTCERKPTFLESSKTLSTERALIRNSINAPKLFTIAKDHSVMANKTIVLIHNDTEFFGDAKQDAWMDCSRSDNSSFCPTSCKDNQACAVMKRWGVDDKGVDYWVSLSKDANLTWSNGDSWKYKITEKKSSWFWRAQSQATFTVIKS